MDVKPKISVITATYNAEQHLPKLIDSLRAQTDQRFEWVVADGGSTDSTLDLLDKVNDLNLKIVKGPDFGIYDGLNRAIKQCTADYYVVAGADDYFYNQAIAYFYEALNATPMADLIVANTQVGDVLIKPKGQKKIWLYGMKACITAHAIGTLINKNLHASIGFYSKSFPIAADELFILKTVSNKATIVYIDTIAGYHGNTGISSTDILGVLLESVRVRLMVGENKLIQLLLLVLRLLKNINRY